MDYFTLEASDVAALNFTTDLAGMVIGAPDVGFTPCRCAFYCTQKVPKPVIDTLSAFSKAVSITFTAASRAALACTLLMLASMAMALMSSDLFIIMD